jgi:hypothetical protein
LEATVPQYVDSPFQVPIFAQDGVATYLFGSFNSHQANTRMLVSGTSLTSDVASLTVQIVEGEVPTIGSLISVIQTTRGSGVFNVNRVPLTAVAISAATGSGTVSFALTSANVTPLADHGTAIVEVPEIPETLVDGNSIACVYQAPAGDSQFTIPLAVTFPTLPTAATVTLQVAVRNQNSEFTNTSTAIVVASSALVQPAPVVQATLQRGYCYRLAVTGVSGTGTIIGKLG